MLVDQRANVLLAAARKDVQLTAAKMNAEVSPIHIRVLFCIWDPLFTGLLRLLLCNIVILGYEYLSFHIEDLLIQRLFILMFDATRFL